MRNEIDNILYECKEVRRSVLELMRYINPYSTCSPSEVFQALTEFDKAVGSIESAAIASLNSGEAEIRRLKVKLEEANSK